MLHSRQVNLLLWTRNTLIIAVLSTLGTTLSSAVAAYGFARLRFPGREPCCWSIMLSTMMIPFPVTMVPLFAEFRWLGANGPVQWLGTLRPLWIPAWFGSAFNIFLLRQFFITLPEELSEAARLDGCGEWGIFWRIILPLSKPALTVVALFAFLYAWNDFLGPLVYLQRPGQFTLALGLQNLVAQHGGAPWQLLMTATVLTILPVLLLFAVAQRAFTAGIATAGLKG